ncbi:galactose-1-phosphate uridylyltransferase [Inquilinus sp. CAU 1745]|uniref:galactose-1-phosphate uridylyltransferase n=1 Tax=Inquilinus sp. CAU 1745 TaxID=3140369 RepID=UPI00325B1221
MTGSESRIPTKRTHVKPDGRRLHLYGWAEHRLPLIAEIDPVPGPTPHLRWHPFRREWVAYAAHRQDRTFLPLAEYCPLCPTRPGGFASEIPFENFEVAVFENRFPAFHPDAPEPPPGLLVPTARAAGQCEVVVYSAAHEGNLGLLTPERRELLVHAWADRYRELLARDDVQCVLPFENRGEAVGVTLHHPHGQIYAFPFVPPVQRDAAATFREGPELARLIDRMGDRYVVAENGTMTAFVPPFARFPYEVWVAPRRPQPGPWTFEDDETKDFAALMGDVVRRYDRLFGRPFPYILSLQAAPKGEEATFHFHAQFYPPLRTAEKMKYLAGVEQAAGTFLVDALPEDTAAQLREAT